MKSQLIFLIFALTIVAEEVHYHYHMENLPSYQVSRLMAMTKSEHNANIGCKSICVFNPQQWKRMKVCMACCEKTGSRDCANAVPPLPPHNPGMP